MFRWLMLAIGVVLASVVLVAGCGGDDDGDGTTAAETPATTAAAEPDPEPEPEPEPDPQPVADPGLPDYTAGFVGGTKLNAAPIPENSGAPHGEVKNVYVNQAPETIAPGGTQAFPYPDGTGVVKTGSQGSDGAAIVAAMRKVQGADPDHGDWVFEEFSRSSADAPYTLLASNESCWGCHAGATDTDWVFTELE